MINGLSIRKKMILALLGATLSALLLAGAATYIHSRATFKRQVVSSLEVLNDMLAVSVKGAVDFDDRQTANDALAALAGDADIISARLYRTDGSLFASFVSPDQTVNNAPPSDSDQTVFGEQSVRLTRTLSAGGRPFARLVLESSFAAQQQQYRESFRILAGVGALACLISLLVAWLAQRVFTDPLLKLTSAAEAIHSSGDYRVRAPASGRDEIGRLAETFNKMLDNIQERDAHLANSLAFQNAILTSAGLAVISTRPDGIVELFNPAAEAMLGYQADEVIGKQTPMLWHVPDRPAANPGRPGATGFAAFVAKVQPGQPHSSELTFARKDGVHFPVLLVVTAMHGPAGELLGYCGIVTNLTERKQAEISLRESEELFRLLVENINDLVLLTTGDGQILYASPNHQTITGRTPQELLGRNPLDFVHATDLLPIATKIHQRLTTGVFRYRFADNSWHWLEASSRAFHLASGELRGVIVSRDVTARVQAEEKHRQLEAQLRQSQKLEAIGTLAGGIAHDFNNILTGIMGNIELAGMDLSAQHSAKQWLRDATKASNRARDLVGQILTFSRRGEQLMSPARIGPVVREALRLLRASLPTTLEIRCEIDEECPALLCDVSQIHQIIMNLGTNAAHAMREQGKHFTVTLKRVVHSPEILTRHPQLRPEMTICLSLRDEGSGMSPATLERIFEPFYTTKAPGEGTGLGLAVVHGIVQDYGGAIVVESKLGVGTEFCLYFVPVDAPVPKVASDSRPTAIPRGQGERILLVDDDALVCNVVTTLVQRLGYVPVPFQLPEEALAAFRQAPASFAAVLTDLTMPQLSGVELTHKLLALRPDIPVIIATGYLRSDAIEEARAAGVIHFVKKPYVIEDLAALLNAAIQPAGPNPASPNGAEPDRRSS